MLLCALRLGAVVRKLRPKMWLEKGCITECRLRSSVEKIEPKLRSSIVGVMRLNKCKDSYTEQPRMSSCVILDLHLELPPLNPLHLLRLINPRLPLFLEVGLDSLLRLRLCCRNGFFLVL